MIFSEVASLETMRLYLLSFMFEELLIKHNFKITNLVCIMSIKFPILFKKLIFLNLILLNIHYVILSQSLKIKNKQIFNL